MESHFDVLMGNFYEMCKPQLATNKVYDEFLIAIQNRNISTIRHTIIHHFDTIVKHSDSQTLLPLIFKNTDHIVQQQTVIIQILELLFNIGINVNDKDSNGQTVLHLAINNRLKQVIDFLISRDADLNVRDQFGNAIISFLIKSESCKCVGFCKRDRNPEIRTQSADFIRWMVMKRWKMNCKNNNGNTALHLAAKYNLLHALPILLEYTRNINIINNLHLTAFQVFTESAKKIRGSDNSKVNEIYEKFLNKGFSVNVANRRGYTPVHDAVEQARLPVVKLMLESFKNVNAYDEDGNTALHIVSNLSKNASSDRQEQYLEIARILMAKGANVYQMNDDNLSPILNAFLNENQALLEIFKEQGFVIHDTYKGSNLLHQLCKFMLKKDQEDVSHRSYMNLNLCYQYYNSMLEKYNSKYLNKLDLLINEGCDVNAKDNMQMTPLHYASRGTRSDIVERLIVSGANIHCQDFDRGFTPLHEAVVFSRENSMALLMQNGADVNAKTKTGETPLHLIKNTNESTIQKMIKWGAQVDVQDNRGFLPLNSAIRHRDIRVMKDLLRFGADINDNAHVLTDEEYAHVSNFIEDHSLKLKLADLPIAKEFEVFVGIPWEMSIYKKIYQKEVESLKCHMLTERISLYDLLRTSRNFSSNHDAIEKLKAIINVPIIESKFPRYHTLLSSTYYMVVERTKMMETATLGWNKLTNITLPDLCMRKIFSYLSNVSLRVLTDGAKYKEDT